MLDSPELPAAARPPWPPWYAPVALLATFLAITVAVLPVLPLIFLSGLSDTLGAIALLVLALLQDGVFIGAAVLFAGFKRSPRAWHFGVRATPFWPTVGWTALAFALMLGIEVGTIELFGVDETDFEQLGNVSGLAAIAIVIVVVLLAPVAEEIFFRAFFYRALRTRLRVWSASLITGCVFASVHLQYYSEPVLLLVIAAFGIGQCLLYERTGSLFAVIATHAAFNTFASLEIAAVPALIMGALVLLACVLVARRVGPAPGPMPA
ncbi:MAG TPA: type II CAAX endopeptidase family protein [Thermoleophilaceae bacterium]|jgi:membrane protease YdiL (CAAX protease family)|nr:CPBP family intramembrane metalloprotease [Actinomycetota bacterium]HYN51676.1 type II CAAX endopeptidase family protein [Thermoleophilaceae bacterium]